MKHPHTGKVLVQVEVKDLQKAAIKNNKVTLHYFSSDDGKNMWVTPQDFALLTGDLVEYPFDEGYGLSAQVDYEDGVVRIHERGGWGCTYTKSFSDLEDLAAEWNVEFDVGATTEEVAMMGMRLERADHMLRHGLSPDYFLPRPPAYLPAFNMMAEWYGDKTAARSGVPLVNHIKDGLEIMKEIAATDAAMSAFCLHRLFQNDEDLLANLPLVQTLDPYVMTLVMEYRSQANRSLSDSVTMEYAFDGIPAESQTARVPGWTGLPPTPGPLPEVRDMLVADKVQNFADFEVHHLGKHERSEELEHYFECWLKALGVGPIRYEELKNIMRRWQK